MVIKNDRKVNIKRNILPKYTIIKHLDILLCIVYTLCKDKRGDFMDINNIELHNIDFEKFIEVVELCKGDVYLETEDGDILNLKSKLCQIIGISSILQHPEINVAKIRCSNPEDESTLFRFNLFGEMPEK